MPRTSGRMYEAWRPDSLLDVLPAVFAQHSGDFRLGQEECGQHSEETFVPVQGDRKTVDRDSREEIGRHTSHHLHTS